CVNLVYFFIFFFQAEDGIRDPLVTGVQTCALPICPSDDAGRTDRSGPNGGLESGRTDSGKRRLRPHHLALGHGAKHLSDGTPWRSEERRVGKECRYGWAPEYKKKKQKQ